MTGWPWHQLDYMQIICTSLQTGSHACTSSLNFLQARCSLWCPANSVKAVSTIYEHIQRMNSVQYFVIFLGWFLTYSLTFRRLVGYAVTAVAAWRSGNVVGRLNEVTLRRARLVVGWVTVFGRANHLSISPSHPGQLSLLPSVGREMSTSQSAVMLCDWGVKAGTAHSTCG